MFPYLEIHVDGCEHCLDPLTTSVLQTKGLFYCTGLIQFRSLKHQRWKKKLSPCSLSLSVCLWLFLSLSLSFSLSVCLSFSISFSVPCQLCSILLLKKLRNFVLGLDPFLFDEITGLGLKHFHRKQQVFLPDWRHFIYIWFLFGLRPNRDDISTTESWPNSRNDPLQELTHMI